MKSNSTTWENKVPSNTIMFNFDPNQTFFYVSCQQVLKAKGEWKVWKVAQVWSSPNVRGADVGGVAKVGRLADHVPADLGTVPDNTFQLQIIKYQFHSISYHYLWLWLILRINHKKWCVPVRLRLLLHDTGAEEVDPELAGHGTSWGVTGPSWLDSRSSLIAGSDSRGSCAVRAPAHQDPLSQPATAGVVEGSGSNPSRGGTFDCDMIRIWIQ